MYLTVGSIIIDDIILPDGRAHMGVLGGGSVHAAMGMRAWSDEVSICAPVGHNFPPERMAELEAYFDTTGVTHSGLVTPRAWQLFEADGHRTELFRTAFSEFQAINPHPSTLPEAIFHAAGVHLQAQAPQPLGDFAVRLRTGGCRFILWEPWESFCQAGYAGLIRQTMPLVDAFSPNLEEARQITGISDPREAVRSLLEMGVPLVVLRMGAEGSLVAARDGRVWQVSAVPVPRIVDVTGAGNAYCGGFVVGMAESGDILAAARKAAVSASLALEQFGAVYPLEGLADKAQARLAQVEISESSL